MDDGEFFCDILWGIPRAIVINAACEVVERCVDIDHAKIVDDIAYVPPKFTWAASHMLEPKNVVDALKRLGGGDIEIDKSKINKCNYTQARFVMSKNCLQAIREKVAEYRGKQEDSVYYFGDEN
jgi:hypothetical protein